MKRKVLALLLASMMAVSLAACGSGNGTDVANNEGSVEEQSPWAYVLEEIDWGIELNENADIEYKGIYDGKLFGIYNGYGENGWEINLLVKGLEEGAETQSIVCAQEEDSYISDAAMTKEGGFVLLMRKSVYNESTDMWDEEAYLSYLDEAGQELNRVSLSELGKRMENEYGYAYFGDLCLDAEGNVYLSCEQSIVALSPEGQELHVFTVSNWINQLTPSQNGKVYASYYEDKFVIAEVNLESKSLDPVDVELGGGNSNLDILENGDMVYYSETGCNYYSAEEDSSSELFKWTDLNIVSYNVVQVSYVDEDTLLMSYHEDSNGRYRMVTALVNRVDRSTIKEKTVLTMAAFSLSSDTQEDIVAFNKQSEEYRIELKTYVDYSAYNGENYEQYMQDAVTRMNNDLTGSNPPDIIFLDGYYTDMNTLVEKGLLEDLQPYYDEAGFAKEDFVESVYDMFTVDGTLYAMPNAFTLETMYAVSDVVGDKHGWTLAEAAEVTRNLPEGMEFFERGTRSMMLNEFLRYGYTEYVDEENATCNFDSDNFKALLELAAQFPLDYEYDPDEPSTPAKISAGTLLATNAYISDLTEIQMIYAQFGNRVPTAIGKPGAPGNGTIINPTSGMYAICSKSDNKEVAAEYIISTLDVDISDGNYYWGFSVLKDVLEAQLQSSMKADYVLDENGEPYLDENGEPMIAGTSSISYGDWEYTYRPATQEEYDEFMELLNGAKATYVSVDEELLTIVTEEAEAFFSGQKSVDEVASTTQNRVSLYLSENS